jgi:N-dimethylarginine dimethylaminohydrolase
MFTKSLARTKAASIKATVDEHHANLEALPEGSEKIAAIASFDRLHRKLNGAARRVAEVFEEPIETFSGGTDRPDEE